MERKIIMDGSMCRFMEGKKRKDCRWKERRRLKDGL